ncbi:MAG: TIGR03564 family F420-dependent LLM class oxidoreductase [Gammaproteobacteria bacterium]|jgi:F420-dependent oxidoreductase-like protein
MKKGLMTGADGGTKSLDDIVAIAQKAEVAGFDSLWMANVFSLDAIMTLGTAGRETDRIEVGTAVTPTYPRHPSAIAQQAVTAASMAKNRFTLGIGLSHKMVIEDMLGMSFAKPARHMKEYLDVLIPLLRGDLVNYDGNEYRVHNTQIKVPGVDDVPVIIAALGPVMLKLAGELTAGTNTWMVGPKTMEQHIVVRLSAAASAAGRPSPRVIGGFPVVLTNAVDQTRAALAEPLAIYGQLPSYRDMLDREGLAHPQDIALIGDEAVLRAGIKRIEESGVTDFNAAIMAGDGETYERTFEFLASL